MRSHLSYTRYIRYMLLFCTLFYLQACTVVDPSKHIHVAKNVSWGLLSFQNHSNDIEAENKIQDILHTLLMKEGVKEISVCPDLDVPGELPVLDEKARYNRSLIWAKKNELALGITGSVKEWRYKDQTESEPVVALTVEIINIKTGEILWRATGARSGWERESLSGAAQYLLRELLSSVIFGNPVHANE